MLFSSTIFIFFFLPLVLFCYYIIFRFSRLLQNVALFVFSLFFYAWGEPYFVFVMLFSIIVNYFFGVLIGRYDKNFNKILLIVSLFYNISLLFVFKYLVFSVTTINNIFSFDIVVPNMSMPIGISFFTFQAMSYVIDVYRGDISAQKNILNLGMYISFFPQLIAGPIVRYKEIEDEITDRKETLKDFSNGIIRFVVGLGKKILLANSFANIADSAFYAVANNQNISILMAWMGIIAYTLQIYFDFSGYSDMAIGLGRVFGFHFSENFNYPYVSKSISEFWRRWHISLGTWIRDYVYFPLGGSRVTKFRYIMNLFIVWFLVGAWHGASWTFITWGLFFFVLIIFEKFTGISNIKKNKGVMFLLWFYTILSIVLSFVLFRSNSLNEAINYYMSMFGCFNNNIVDGTIFQALQSVGLFLPLGLLLTMPVVPVLKKKLCEINEKLYSVISTILLFAVFIISVANIIGSSYNPFIYFNF